MKTRREIRTEMKALGFLGGDPIQLTGLLCVLEFCGVVGEDTTEDGAADDLAAKLARYRTAHARLGLKTGAERDKANAEIAELKRELELADLRREEAIACNTEVWDLLGGGGRLVDRVREVMEERSRAIRKRTEADDARRETHAALHKTRAELARCQGDLEITHHQQQAAIDDACENVRAHERAKPEAARAGFEAVRLKLEEAVNQLGIERDKGKWYTGFAGCRRCGERPRVVVSPDDGSCVVGCKGGASCGCVVSRPTADEARRSWNFQQGETTPKGQVGQ